MSLTLAAAQNADGLWLSNTGDAPLTAQVRVYRWRQLDGEDQLEPTRDLTISPPMVQLPGGEKQLVRVIRLGAPPAEVEASYRVIIDELPLPDTVPPAAGAGRRAGLQLVLRYSLPVFLTPPMTATRPDAPALRSSLEGRLGGSNGKTYLEISNSGTVHAQITDLAFVDAAGRRLAVRDGLAGYVLPGQHRRWTVPATLPLGDAGAFKGRVDGELTDRTLLQQRPPNRASGDAL
ncbi:fimbrial biogenesis chaperone [Variovorax sp. PAMC 28711]|uniref:fimbrial biogenesis chaperone n=1 Tax=Variovorax sp. PAMC 28711 TaxID=1795631 RepID=UPI001AEFC332|nr:fimbria/pilus periplasmic chaperone [Variovorax sp. PAMC 28711]